MITVKAKLKLYKGTQKRQIPFQDGYRPAFDIFSDSLISGMIHLVDREYFYPGDEGVVEIKFLYNDIKKNKVYYFYEGEKKFGEIIINEILT